MDERFEPCVRCGFRRPVRVMKIGPSEVPDPLAPVSGTRGFSCKRLDHCDLLLGLRALPAPVVAPAGETRRP